MVLKAGLFIQSTDAMDDATFRNAVVYLTEVNETGVVGFTINKAFPRKFNELVEFSTSQAFPLNDGGPVDREHLFFMHKAPDLIPDGNQVANNVYKGGDFEIVVEALNMGLIDQSNLKLFIGYCGWDSGELEEEIHDGYWEVLPGNAFKIFSE